MPSLWIDISTKRTKRLLFKFDPINEQIEIKHRDGIELVDLAMVKRKNAKRITETQLRGLTPNPETA